MRNFKIVVNTILSEESINNIYNKLKKCNIPFIIEDDSIDLNCREEDLLKMLRINDTHIIDYKSDFMKDIQLRSNNNRKLSLFEELKRMSKEKVERNRRTVLN